MQRIWVALAIPMGVLLVIFAVMATFRVVLLSFSKEVAPAVALAAALAILVGAAVLARGGSTSGEPGH